MAGFIPAIHVFLTPKTWMAGTSPAMTEKESVEVYWRRHDAAAFLLHAPSLYTIGYDSVDPQAGPRFRCECAANK
jgi:hypothetical protein